MVSMTTSLATPLVRARFNTLIRPYLVLYVGIILVSTVVCIPLAVIWFCGVGQWWARHYFEKLECELTDRTIRYRKGILFTVEKTIPLENIQDVTFVEGPLLRRFHLSVLKFETAGRSEGQANDMELVGVVDAELLRNEIVRAREALKHPPQQMVETTGSADHRLIDALEGLRQSVDELAALMRERKE